MTASITTILIAAMISVPILPVDCTTAFCILIVAVITLCVSRYEVAMAIRVVLS